MKSWYAPQRGTWEPSFPSGWDAGWTFWRQNRIDWVEIISNKQQSHFFVPFKGFGSAMLQYKHCPRYPCYIRQGQTPGLEPVAIWEADGIWPSITVWDLMSCTFNRACLDPYWLVTEHWYQCWRQFSVLSNLKQKADNESEYHRHFENYPKPIDTTRDPNIFVVYTLYICSICI